MKKTRRKLLYILIPIVIVALVLAAVFAMRAIELANAPEPDVSAVMDELLENARSKVSASEQGQLLQAAYAAAMTYELEGAATRDGRAAEQGVKIYSLDFEKLSQGLNAELDEQLAQAVSDARLSSEVYNDDNSFKAEVLEQAFSTALNARLESAGEYLKEKSLIVKLEYKEKMWFLVNSAELESALGEADLDAAAQQLFAAATENPSYVEKRYTIEETALYGEKPNQSAFVETTDPADVEAMLQTPLAQKLIGGQELAWSAELEFIPGRSIGYYLDETILAIVWQEEEALGVGTFSEVIIADGSQLRRRIAGDEFESFDFDVPTGFAARTNAVLAVGGDFYHHARACGIVVYNREILRFEPKTSDTCYITSSGDMIFSYREQFSEQSEAQAFIEENDVLFSLCFGPVLIDNGIDVTPDYYMWGEVDDSYARSVLGMLGERHYLTMNINCEMPNYFYLATLRQAVDAVIEKGCIKAYALDGGQTAATVFGGELINLVQFGWEKPTSDIIYFASALPSE